MTTDPLWQQPPQGGPMSIEEYFQLEKSAPLEKYEYLSGVTRLMSGGSVEHNRIAFNIHAALDQHFRSGPCAVFGSDVQTLVGLKPSGKAHYVYPDVTVSCDVADRRRGTMLIRTPRIVVEVLSPSTEATDRGPKLEAYKTCPSIQEIVLINQFVQAIEVYRRNEEDSTSWSHVFYGIEQGVELHSVDIFIPINEIYKGINFDEPLIEE